MRHASPTRCRPWQRHTITREWLCLEPRCTLSLPFKLWFRVGASTLLEGTFFCTQEVGGGKESLLQFLLDWALRHCLSFAWFPFKGVASLLIIVFRAFGGSIRFRARVLWWKVKLSILFAIWYFGVLVSHYLLYFLLDLCI